MGDRVIVGFELMDRGERSTERREFWREEGESVSDLVTPLLSLLTLGVAGDDLAGVSDNPDLFSSYRNRKKKKIIIIVTFYKMNNGQSITAEPMSNFKHIGKIWYRIGRK